jgi:ankyrin repeat protein
MKNNRKNQIKMLSNKELLEMGYFLMEHISTFGTKMFRWPVEQMSSWTLIIRSAIEDSDVQRVRKLIETGVDISQAKWGRKANALHVASQYAKTTELIDVILETGQFDINGVDNDGETPLHYAINGRNPTIARHLIQMGADPKIANYNGITPLESKAMDLIELITNSYRSLGDFGNIV